MFIINFRDVKSVDKSSMSSSSSSSTTTTTNDEETASSRSSEEDDSESDNDNKNNSNDEIKVVTYVEESVNNGLSKRNVPELVSNIDLLLDLDNMESFTPTVITPSLGGFLTPISHKSNSESNYSVPSIQLVTPIFWPIESIELLNKINGRGIEITYKYNRNPHLISPSMVNIGLTFTNTSRNEIHNIRMGQKVSILTYLFAK